MDTKEIPLFPLNIVAFPGETVNLHIFEPRYRQLVKDCLLHNLKFGIPVFINGKVSNYGTLMELVSVEKQHQTGEMDIKTLALQVFKVIEFKKKGKDKLYPTGTIELISDVQDENYLIKEQIKEQVTQLYEALKVNRDMEQISPFQIAHYIGLKLDQEFDLLKIENESDRQDFVLEHLLKIVPVVIETERTRERIRMNGHFKNLDPLDFEGWDEIKK